MAGQLTDDGTMDTVIRCSECGEEERFTFMPYNDEDTYDDFVKWCIAEFDEEHECATETPGDAQ